MNVQVAANKLFDFCRDSDEEGFNSYYNSLTEEEKSQVEKYMCEIKSFIEATLRSSNKL